MRKHLTYKITVFAIALFILLASVPSIIISGKGEIHLQEQPEDTMQISIAFPGLKGVKGYTINISTERYEELCRIFNNTLKSLQNTETEREAREIFNVTILKLVKLGIIPPTINVTRLQKLVTGSYHRDPHREKILKIMEKMNFTEKCDNVLCLVCGATSNSFKIDFSSRLYDLLVRTPLLSIGLLLYAMAQTIRNGVVVLFLFFLSIPFLVACTIPVTSPISFVGTICFGSSLVIPIPWAPTYDYPAYGFLWTRGQKGVKTWDGKFYGDFSLEVLVYYFPLLLLGCLLENISENAPPSWETTLYNLAILLELYSVITYAPIILAFGFPYPGVTGFTGICIDIPPYAPGHFGSSFFMGHAVGVSIKEA